ncbi:MAG: hypothetical protein IIT65_08585 [Lachnospiraceae bacterium]|nr:hypothetical protein [Lachnospiraceae bacterium]
MEYTKGLRVVLVNGRQQSGKTTFENICRRLLGNDFCACRSTVDKVKEIAQMGGWDGKKTPAARKLLSDLKDIFTEYNDMPAEDIKAHLRAWDNEFQYYDIGNRLHVFFIDDREPEHIDRLKKELNAITLLIRRPGDEDSETSNHADQNVFEYEYDYTIWNNGDLKDLEYKAKKFIDLICD